MLHLMKRLGSTSEPAPDAGALVWSSACTGNCLLQVLDTDTLLIHEDPSTLDGLRAFDIGSGEAVWRLPKPRLRPLSCGATVLTSSDLVVACECSATKDTAPLAWRGGETEGLGAMGEGDEEARKSLCVYSVRPTDGKLQWEAAVASEAGSSGGDAGLLPFDALAYGQRPTVLADSLVIPLRRGVVSVQRRPSLLPGPDGRKAGAVLWHLQLPEAYVVDGWATMMLHAGVLILQVSREDAADSNTSAAPRILLALNPANGQVTVTESCLPALSFETCLLSLLVACVFARIGSLGNALGSIAAPTIASELPMGFLPRADPDGPLQLRCQWLIGECRPWRTSTSAPAAAAAMEERGQQGERFGEVLDGGPRQRDRCCRCGPWSPQLASPGRCSLLPRRP